MIKAWIEYNAKFAWERWIVIFLLYESILKERKMRMIDSFTLKMTCFLVRWDWNDKQSQIFHINSSTHKNSINVIYKIALILSSLSSLLISWIIYSKISIMRDNLMRYFISTCIHLSSQMIRSIWESSKIEVI